MKKPVHVSLLASLALLAACEAKLGGDDPAAGGNVTAEGKSANDMVSIKAPGVDIKVNIPEAMKDEISSEGDTLYPGSTVEGMHIEAGGGGEKNGAVELRFASADAPDKVAAWYRDPARADIAIDREAREGTGFVFNGHQKDDNSPFKLRLSPRAGGGTDGVLSIQD